MVLDTPTTLKAAEARIIQIEATFYEDWTGGLGWLGGSSQWYMWVITCYTLPFIGPVIIVGP